MTCDSVDLPEPFGTMIACTSPWFTVSDSPWRISRSSTRTCRFLTSSSDIELSLRDRLRDFRHCEEFLRRSNPALYRPMDCFAELVIGRAFARPVGSQ